MVYLYSGDIQNNGTPGDKNRWPAANLEISPLWTIWGHTDAQWIHKLIVQAHSRHERKKTKNTRSRSFQCFQNKRWHECVYTHTKNTVTHKVTHMHTNKQKHTHCNTQVVIDMHTQSFKHTHRPKPSSKASLGSLFRVYRYYSDQLAGRSSLERPIWAASLKAWSRSHFHLLTPLTDASIQIKQRETLADWQLAQLPEMRGLLISSEILEEPDCLGSGPIAYILWF